MIKLIDHYLSKQFDKFLSQESQAREGSDPEAVHQMRVATRRIRAAFRAFKKFLPISATKSFSRDFKWVAAALGDVRDLDVYLGNLKQYAEELAEEDTVFLSNYHAYLDNQWQEARKRLLECLSSERYLQLKMSFVEFLKKGPSQSIIKPAGTTTIRAAARKTLRKQYKIMLRHGRAITPNSPENLFHELRIECKRLRYLLDIFRPVYGKTLNRPIQKMKCLQSVLGEFQDAQFAVQNLRAYADHLPMQTKNRGQLITLGQLIHIQYMQGAKQRNAFKKVWQRFDRNGRRKEVLTILAEPEH